MTQDLHVAEPLPIYAEAEQQMVTAQLDTPTNKHKNNFGWHLFNGVLSMLVGSAFLAVSVMSFLHAGVDLIGVAALLMGFPPVNYGFIRLRMAMLGHAEPKRV